MSHFWFLGHVFWHEQIIIFLDTTFTIPICTPHSVLESRESGDHRGMYGGQIRVFFLVHDFAFNGALCTSFLFIHVKLHVCAPGYLKIEIFFFVLSKNGSSDLSATNVSYRRVVTF